MNEGSNETSTGRVDVQRYIEPALFFQVIQSHRYLSHRLILKRVSDS
jgi:hypothetical protein